MKKKVRPLKFVLADSTQKVIMIDETKSILELTNQMAEKVNLESQFTENFGVRTEESSENCKQLREGQNMETKKFKNNNNNNNSLARS